MTFPIEVARGGRRVWTLLEIMRKFRTNGLINLHTRALTFTLRHTQPISRPMSVLLSRFGRQGAVSYNAQFVTEQDRAELGAWVSSSERECVDMELLATAATLRRIQRKLDKEKCRYEDIWQDGRELAVRLTDELEGRFFLSLDAREAALYTTPLQEWERVAEAFPGATSDMEEASRCFALGRYTAGVFHLMRVVEAGVQATRRCLSIAEPSKPAERNWGFILRNIKEEMVRRKTAGWANAEDASFFDEIYVSLDAVKNAWRNATMHVENKYTEEEAEHVLSAVRGFMRKLAERMNEQGMPCA
jgi:hypothetical protein